MTEPLWTIEHIARATGGTIDGPADAPVTGVSIDTRTLEAGDLFVPLSDKRDGHDFVAAAFDKGATCALVAKHFSGAPAGAALIRVEDPLQALENLARAARARLRPDASVIAVTGSVGKTGTKDMLRTCFSALGGTHAAAKSFNNHWGVPLTLARTPKDVACAIYEIGMNHPGEITPLTKMVQPTIAIVTTVEPVHLEFFDSVEQIAEAKAEIFAGLVSGGVAILNADNPHFALLSARAKAVGARIVSFGKASDADVCLKSFEAHGAGSRATAQVFDKSITYTLEIPGEHVALNALAVAAALECAGQDVAKGMYALSDMRPVAGRGAREVMAIPGGRLLLIDESYNANPASMRAALGVLSTVARADYPRRIAILGDMLELGEASSQLHGDLADAVAAADVDLVFACGKNMASLFRRLPEEKQGDWAGQVEGIEKSVLAALRPGDAIMIKGSLGSRMAHVLAAIRKEFEH